jgi:hypothetical protein
VFFILNNTLDRKRMLGLATQKFISDIATDALEHSKQRQQAILAKDKKLKVK